FLLLCVICVDEIIFLFVICVMFPVYVNTIHGIRNVDPQLVEMGRMYNLKGWKLFKDILFPGALPSIFVGLRYALGVMWLTLIVAETIPTQVAIGYLATNSREFMQTDVIVRSEEHTSELQSRFDLVCRLLLAK